MDRNERSEEDASRLSSPRIYPSRPETKRMTCASNSGIEVSEMRGRRAAFIYPARSDTRILRLLHSPPPPPLHRAFHPSSLPSLSSSSSSYRAHSVDLLFPSLLSVFFIDRQRGAGWPFFFSPVSLFTVPPSSVGLIHAEASFGLDAESIMPPLLPLVFALECKLCLPWWGGGGGGGGIKGFSIIAGNFEISRIVDAHNVFVVENLLYGSVTSLYSVRGEVGKFA